MKRSQLVLFGGMGIVAIAAMIIASPFAFNKKGSYEKSNLTFLKDQSASDAKAWMEARYIDFETGEKITPEKLVQIEKSIKAMSSNKALSLTWIEQGPDNIGGRTRAILIDRTNEKRIFAGSVSGGLFVSENSGNTWTKLDTYTGSNFISSMTQTQNGTIIVSTGSSHDNWSGNGAWYSSDFGATWTLVPGSASESRISEVVCSGTNNKVFLACSGGLKSWTIGDADLTDISTTSGTCTALSISNDGNTIVAGVSNRTFVSNDAGNNFTNVSGNGSGQINIASGRIEYAISATKNNSGNYNIYGVLTTSANGGSNLQGMFTSKDGGQTWSKFIGSSGTPSSLDIYRNQGTYNSIVSVNPTDNESILVGGIDVWKWKQTSSNPVSGGFEKVSQWFVNPSSPIYVHADNHEMKWSSNNILYVGNDGGVGKSNNFGQTWYPSNRGYNVTQYYGIAFDRNGAVMGGAQDNGTTYNDHSLSTYKEFREVTGGDGFECEISFFNPKIMFSTVQFGDIRRSSDGGFTSSQLAPPYPGAYGAIGSGSAFPFHTEIFLAEYFLSLIHI